LLQLISNYYLFFDYFVNFLLTGKILIQIVPDQTQQSDNFFLSCNQVPFISLPVVIAGPMKFLIKQQTFFSSGS